MPQIHRINVNADFAPGNYMASSGTGLRPNKNRFKQDDDDDPSYIVFPLDGVFQFRRKVTRPEVRDGLSSTVAFSETIQGRGDNVRAGADPRYHYAFLGEDTIIHSVEPTDLACSKPAAGYWHDRASRWINGMYLDSLYNHYKKNDSVPDCLSDPHYFPNTSEFVTSPLRVRARMTARSNHRGGVNVVMVDGTTRFINDDIDLNIWRGLATRAGKEVVSDF